MTESWSNGIILSVIDGGIHSDGEVMSWNLYATMRPDEITFQIWRPISAKGRFILIGQNTATLTGNYISI